MERRQAEFLVHERFPVQLFYRFGVATPEAQKKVQRGLESSGLEIYVEVKRDWYF
jgi:hypothetical protein